MKQDDRGVSLVEILIATAILVICVVPLFKSLPFRLMQDPECC